MSSSFLNFVVPLSQRAATRWLVDLGFLCLAKRLEITFGLVAFGIETVFVGELDEGEPRNGELRPMSPWNHAQVLA